MSKFVGTGPSSYKKRIYRAAVWQRLRNTALDRASTGIGCFQFYQEYHLFFENCHCPQPNKIFSLFIPLHLHPTGHEQDDKVYVWV